MANFMVRMQRTASATLDVGSVLTGAANPRRFKVYDIIIGSEGTPADTGFLWELYKRTGTAVGGTAPAITTLDDSDADASEMVANQAPTTNGAGGSVTKLSIPLNQRATFRWVAAPGGELIAPATASNGLAAATPTAGGAVAVTATFHLQEL